MFRVRLAIITILSLVFVGSIGLWFFASGESRIPSEAAVKSSRDRLADTLSRVDATGATRVEVASDGDSAWDATAGESSNDTSAVEDALFTRNRLTKRTQDELVQAGAEYDLLGILEQSGIRPSKEVAERVAEILITTKQEYTQKLNAFSAYEATLTEAERKLPSQQARREQLFDEHWGSRLERLSKVIPEVDLIPILDKISGGWPLDKK